MMLIEARNLTKSYHQGKHVTHALDWADLSVEKGRFVSIVGRSGSGKSTLAGIMAGLLRPTAGSVMFQGQPYAALGDAALCELRNKHIGYIPQGMCLLGNFTVLDNVRMPCFLGTEMTSVTERARSFLDRVGLLELCERYPHQLSGGQMRRVAIARAFMNDPDLIIADEPTSNLDQETAGEITALLKDACAQGTAVVVVSHEQDTLRFSDAVYTMEGGKIRPGAG